MVSTRDLNKIIEISTEEARVEAGVILQDIEGGRISQCRAKMFPQYNANKPYRRFHFWRIWWRRFNSVGNVARSRQCASCAYFDD